MKKTGIILIFILLCVTLSCCNFDDNNKEDLFAYPEKSDLEYVDYGSIQDNYQYITDYNENMWFYNDLKDVPLADPFVYSEDGKYYITGTNDPKEGDTIDIYVTEDFNNYTKFEAYVPHAKWEKTGKDALIFAPEIHKYEGYYYLSYSNIAKEDNVRYISILKSTNIMGPFEIIQEYNSLGEYIDGDEQPLLTYDKELKKEVLDQHFFNDNGKLYLYYSIFDSNYCGHIVGAEMIDPITVDWSTYKELVIPGAQTPNSKDTDMFYWETYTIYPPVNEAPFVIKSDNGKYYMTYSVNHYPNRYYSVCYAVSDSPLGEYVKPYKEGETWTNLLFGYGGEKTGDLYDDWGGFMSGCGHHAFFYAGTQLMVGYHAHANHGKTIVDSWMARGFAYDYVHFDDEGNLYVNGPSYSLQPLPSVISGYENIALEAKVTGVNVSNVSNVNDNYIVSNFNLNYKYNDKEVVLGKDFSYILLEFDGEYEIAGLSVYNSSKYDKMIYDIEFINFFNNNAVFNINFPLCYYDEEKEFIFPNSSFAIEVSDVVTDKIVICFNLEDVSQINEIKVYGKKILN